MASSPQEAMKRPQENLKMHFRTKKNGPGQWRLPGAGVFASALAGDKTRQLDGYAILRTRT
jgi:hypothetical protein